MDIIRNGKLFFTNAVDVYRMIDQAREHNATKLERYLLGILGCMESDEAMIHDEERQMTPEIAGYSKVYRSSGMNAIDLNGTRQFLPDELSQVNAELIDGEWYVPYSIYNS